MRVKESWRVLVSKLETEGSIENIYNNISIGNLRNLIQAHLRVVWKIVWHSKELSIQLNRDQNINLGFGK